MASTPLRDGRLLVPIPPPVEFLPHTLSLEQRMSVGSGFHRRQHGTASEPSLIPADQTLGSMALGEASHELACESVSLGSRTTSWADSYSRKLEEVKLVLISDPGQDLDDEMTYIMIRHLVSLGMCKILGVVATLTPTMDRARLIRGTLDTLGLFGVPVGVGTDGGDKTRVHKACTFEDWAKQYMPRTHSERGTSFWPGRRLLHSIYQDALPRSVTMVIIASLKDAALFLRDNETLFVAKTREVVIMGGVEEWEKDGAKPPYLLRPDTAHNNMFDFEASKFFYRRCQELNVRLIVVSRWSAYAAKMRRSCYDELAALGSPIACRLRNAQRSSIESLWKRAASPLGSPERRGLPDRCDGKWFLKAFCSGRETDRGPDESIWDLVEGFMQYDTLAALAAFPDLRRSFYRPVVVNGMNGTKHLVIGRTEEDHNVRDPPGLCDFLTRGYLNGIALNHREKRQFILVCQPRWNNRADVLLALVMFRSIYELGIIDCAGIVLSMGEDEDEHEAMMKEEVQATLLDLGVAHIPVISALEDKGNTVSDHLKTLYDLAPPSGVALLVTGTVGDLSNFVEEHNKLFTEKTQVVIVRSGAFVVETAEGPELVPDPEAQNNSMDLEGAEKFLRSVQRLLVPLVIMSRHMASACDVPRGLFDELGLHGGALGKKLKDIQQNSLRELWEAANSPPGRHEARRDLPDRCNREWFQDSFCMKGPVTPDDIWQSVAQVRLYAPMAVLAVLPRVLAYFAKGKTIKVRSVEHVIIGPSTQDTGLTDALGVRSLIFQCLLNGARVTASEFDLGRPGPISLGSSGATWQFNSRQTCLDWILEPAKQEDGLEP